MKRWLVVPLLALAAAGCDEEPNVVVRASLAPGQPVASLPVRLLPYDRRALLDSLAEEHGTPEPAFPPELLERLRSLRAEEQAVKPRGDTAVARVRAQQGAVLQQLRALQQRRQAWADSAYAGLEEAVRERLEALGQPELVDTTDAAGRAAFAADEEAQWWLYARYLLPDAELEWSEPVTLRPDSAVVELTRGNARARPFF